MQDLNEFVESGKIGNIVRYDITNDNFSNPKNEFEFYKGTFQSAPMIGNGDDAPHFDLARPGEDVDEKIENLGKSLQNNGVE